MNLNSVWRNFALRKDPTAWEDNPDVNFPAWQFVKNSVAQGAAGDGADTAASIGRRVEGRYYHTVQMVGQAGDTLKVQGSLDRVTWVDIAVTPVAGGASITTIVADGIYVLTGLFKFIRPVVGSPGTAMQAYFLSAAP